MDIIWTEYGQNMDRIGQNMDRIRTEYGLNMDSIRTEYGLNMGRIPTEYGQNTDRIRTEYPIFDPHTGFKKKYPHSSQLSSPIEFWREMTKDVVRNILMP